MDSFINNSIQTSLLQAPPPVKKGVFFSLLLNIGVGIITGLFLFGSIALSGGDVPKIFWIMIISVFCLFILNCLLITHIPQGRIRMFMAYTVSASVLIGIALYLSPPTHIFTELMYGDPVAIWTYYMIIPSQIITWLLIYFALSQEEVHSIKILAVIISIIAIVFLITIIKANTSHIIRVKEITKERDDKLSVFMSANHALKVPNLTMIGYSFYGQTLNISYQCPGKPESYRIEVYETPIASAEPLENYFLGAVRQQGGEMVPVTINGNAGFIWEMKSWITLVWKTPTIVVRMEKDSCDNLRGEGMLQIARSMHE